MSANIRESKIAIGYVEQAALATANILADFRTVAKINAQLVEYSPNVEDDALDLGKGHEFAVNTFKLGTDVRFTHESYLTSEMMAFALAYGLGTSVASNPEGGAYRHTAVPLDSVSADSIELPTFSVIEAIRQGGSAVIDRMFVGVVVEGWTLNLNSGPGRQNAQLNIECVGTGKITEPSAITIPSPMTQHSLNAGSASIVINGVNYVSTRNFVSAEIAWRNAHRLDSGFYPGSGTDGDGFQLRGRMEHGDREATLNFVARFENGSSELTKLRAQTGGTAVITLQGDLITGATYHDASLTFHQVRFKLAEIGDADGIVTVRVECAPMYHSSNGVLTGYATNLEALVAAES